MQLDRVHLCVYITLLYYVKVTECSLATQVQSQHLGCFTDSTLQSYQFHTEVKPVLTFEVCLHLCANKFTTFAGIQTRKKRCYCGEALIQLAVKTDQQYCDRCTESPDNYCGGNTTISLYKLVHQSKIALLLSTKDGVEFLINNQSIPILKSKSDTNTAVAYHGARGEIYLTQDKKILRLTYYPILMTYLPPTAVFENTYDVGNVCVDWRNDSLYFTTYSTDNSYNNIFVMGILDGSNLTRLARSDKNFAIDSYDRTFLYDVYNGKLYGNERSKAYREIKIQGLSSFVCLMLSLDHHWKTIYVVGTLQGESCLVSTKYNGFSTRVLYCGTELSRVTTLDVFNDTIFWVNVDSQGSKIFQAQLSLRGYLESPIVQHNRPQKIYSLKIFHPEVQTSVNDSCKRLACSHQCTAITFSTVVCSCPVDMKLESDGRTCRVLASTTEYATRDSETTKEITTEKTKESVDRLSTSQYSTRTEREFTTIKVLADNKKPTTNSTNSYRVLIDFLEVLTIFGLFIGILFVLVEVRKYRKQITKQRTENNVLRQQIELFSD